MTLLDLKFYKLVYDGNSLNNECPKLPGIYVWHNTSSDKVYVGKGSGVDGLRARIQSEIATGKRGVRCGATALSDAFKSVGIEFFRCYILAVFHPKTEETEVLKGEISFISLFKSNERSHGYNLTDGGDGSAGTCPSDETRKALSEAQFGKEKPTLHKKAVFRSPTGERVAVVNITKFSDDRGLNRGHMSAIARGDESVKSYKGWSKWGSDLGEHLKKASKLCWLVKNGTLFKIFNLNRFCKFNNINQGAMNKLALGKCKSSFGFRAATVEELTSLPVKFWNFDKFEDVAIEAADGGS